MEEFPWVWPPSVSGGGGERNSFASENKRTSWRLLCCDPLFLTPSPTLQGRRTLPRWGFFVAGSSLLVLLAACYLSLGEGSLRPGEEGECFPWPLTVSGALDPSLLPELLASLVVLVVPHLI